MAILLRILICGYVARFIEFRDQPLEIGHSNLALLSTLKLHIIFARILNLPIPVNRQFIRGTVSVAARPFKLDNTALELAVCQIRQFSSVTRLSSLTTR